MNNLHRSRIVLSQGRRILLAASLLMAVWTHSAAAPSPALANSAQSPDSPTQTITYAATDEDFLNPERGFYQDIDLLEQTNFPWVRSQGYSVAYGYIRLANYRNQDLPADVLQKLDAGFNRIREAGMKVIPRFSYTSEYGSATSEPDAPLWQVQRHIEQLAPYLQKHADVLMLLHAGFIGAWGEWHTSSNGLTSAQNKSSVMQALLLAVPKSRTIQFRYPRDIMAAYPSALSESDAFDGSDQSRLAHHNDCFLSNYHDSGTWIPESNLEGLKNYIAKISQFVPVGGETCSDGGSGARDDCPTALREMARFHWSYIDNNTPSRWSNEGCRWQIARSLGYRFQLNQVTLPDQVAQGQVLAMQVDLQNKGYASPFNPRAFEVILRNTATGAIVTLPVGMDPRRWWGGQSQSLAVNVFVPAQTPAGTYEVLLNLPDPAGALHDRAEYSIRLANANVWESSTGYNRLNATIQVAPGNGQSVGPITTPTPPPANWARIYLPRVKR